MHSVPHNTINQWINKRLNCLIWSGPEAIFIKEWQIIRRNNMKIEATGSYENLFVFYGMHDVISQMIGLCNLKATPKLINIIQGFLVCAPLVALRTSIRYSNFSYDWVCTPFRLVIWFIDHLQIVTTSNYCATADSHSAINYSTHLSLLSLLCFHKMLPGNSSPYCMSCV
jgi:hypothetical protein